MSDKNPVEPYRITEADPPSAPGSLFPAPAPPDQAEGEKPAPDPLAGYFASEPNPSLPGVYQQVLRKQIADLIRAHSDLEDELDDLKKNNARFQRKLFMSLLTIGDSLDRLLKLADPGNEVTESVNAIRSEYFQILSDYDIEPIRVRVGQLMDDESCEVAMREPRTDLEPGTIILIERRGYTWQSRTLRPARVVISYHP